MRALYSLLVGAAGISILAACTSGQSAIEPPSVGADVQNTSSLQFRVGTANYQGTTYLNTVVTFRQPNGLSATLFNTPTITGPPGFVVAGCPSASNGAIPPVTTVCSDNGTNHISGTPPTQPGTAMTVTTFNQTGGAFAYGFAPANSTTGGGANYPKVSTASSQIPGVSATNAYMQPIYLAAGARLPFLLGPPAVPDFHPNTNGQFPASFAGYDSGFVMFAVPPVAGAYAFNLTVPSANIGANSAVFNQTATMASVVPLPSLTAPVQGGGAGTAVTITVPAAPAGVSSRVIYAAVRPGPSTTTGVLFFAWNVGPAASTVSIAPNNMTAGDRVYSWQVGANFDIVGGAPPANLSPAPALPAQTDVTVSPPQLVPTTF